MGPRLGPPLGVSSSSSSPSSATSGSCSSNTSAPAALAGWTSMCRLRPLRWGEGGGGVVCHPLLPPSPFSASPSACLRSAFLVVPVPWPLGVEPVLTEPGFGHYVGRLLTFRELTGPRCPRPAPWASPSPLVGEVRPRCLPSRLYPLLRPLPLRLVLIWGGGVLIRSWGCPPIIWFRPRTNGVRGCSGGAPPLPHWLESCLIPHLPTLHTVRLGHTLLGRSPLGAGGAGSGVPLSVHAVR